MDVEEIGRRFWDTGENQRSPTRNRSKATLDQSSSNCAKGDTQHRYNHRNEQPLSFDLLPNLA